MQECINTPFGCIYIKPVDFFRIHYLVYDSRFCKIGTCNFCWGFWFFNPVASDRQYRAETIVESIRLWLNE